MAPTAESPRSSSVDLRNVEVRWMTSGRTACNIQVGLSMTAADVKAKIRDTVGVPPEEQRLFVDNEEIAHGDASVGLHTDVVMLVRCQSDPRVTNLRHFHYSGEFAQLPVGAFTRVKKISDGISGDVIQYRWSNRNDAGDDERVAVKRLRREQLDRQQQHSEPDERAIFLRPGVENANAEDALTELGVFSYLGAQSDVPKYILRMLGIFNEGPYTWLVTELAEGGELFQVAASTRLPEAKVRRYTMELLTAVEYLHRHQIGHRDISLENVLLKDDTVRLMDFGMAVQSHSDAGTPLRFFRAVGKPYYRAPECYVPKLSEVTVVPPPGAAGSEVRVIPLSTTRATYLSEVKLPTAIIPGQPCKAEVWGYTVQPADVFAVGVCMFILAYQCPPWAKAAMGDGYFSYVQSIGSQGIPKLLQHWGKPLLSDPAMEFLVSCLASQPTERPSVEQLLSGPWFQSEEPTGCPQPALGGC